MGGVGSGPHGFSKLTVEWCRALDSGRLMSLGILGCCVRMSATISWVAPATGETVSRLGLEVDTQDEVGTLGLSYGFADSRGAIEYTVGLTSTRMVGGRRRWWFFCPLLRGGGPCGRRVGKLYLPRGGRYFGCRHCHDLTYDSCQATRSRRGAASLARLVAGLSGRSGLALGWGQTSRG